MSPKVFGVGNTRSEQAGYEHLARAYQAFKDEMFEDLVFDFATCRFFDANLAAPLGAIRALLVEKANVVKRARLTDKVRGALTRNGFFAPMESKERVDKNLTTIPYARFNLGEARSFLEYLQSRVFTMHDLPPLARAWTKALEGSLLEIFQNAEMHGRSKHGVFCCGQYYPQTRKTIVFTLVDTGMGFSGSLKAAGYEVADDQAALRAVVEQRWTSRTEKTGGLGIRRLQQFVDRNGGSVEIVSLDGYWRYVGSQSEFNTMGARFPGTLVNLSVRVDNGGP